MKPLVVAILLIFQTFEGISQRLPDDFYFDHVSLPGAIRSTQVTSIVQDKFGLIWVGGDGLFKYDGFKITNYKNVEGVGSIGGREINALFFDEEGNRLLIGTFSFGLIEYNYQTDKLRKIPCKGQPPIISAIERTSDGMIWLNSFSDGLHYLENDTIRRLPDPANLIVTLTSMMAVEDQLLVNAQRSIFIIKGKSIIDTLHVQINSSDLPDFTRITAMTLDRKGKAWFGTERSGVIVYDLGKKKALKHFKPEESPFFNRITSIFEDSNGLVWILAKSNGIAVYSRETDSYVHLTRSPVDPQSLSGDNCAAILEDKSGIIWVGSTGDLNKYDPGKVRFKHIFQNPLDQLSLSDNMVRGIFEDKSGIIWIGTDGSTIHRYDRKLNQIEKIPARLPGMSGSFIAFYFQELDDDRLLIASSQGLIDFNRKTKSFKLFEPLQKKTQGKVVRQVLQIDRDIYFTSQGTFSRYNMDTGDYQQFVDFLGNKSERVSNATTIYADTKNQMWVGGAGGVSLFHPENNSFSFYPLKLDSASNRGSYFMILSIQEYNDKLLIGTFNSGLWVVDPESPNEKPDVFVIDENDGLPNNTVYAAIPENDNLWITTNRGLVRYNAHDSSFVHFSVSEGLQQEEFNRQAFHKCENGDIVIGGINGVNIFNPKEISIPEGVYVPIILSVNAYNTGSGDEQYVSFTTTNTAGLSSNQNYIEIDFLIPSYREPRRFDVYHKLEGYDRDWALSETNAVRYTNLEPGTYTFHVRTVSSSGQEKSTSVTITIHPPFYSTTWFIGLALAAVSLIVFTIIQSYARKSRHDKKKLEALLMERTKEIVSSREELANLNQKKDLIFSILSHDLRSPLTTLKGFLTVLIDASHTLTPEELKRHATSIRNSVTSSLDLIDNTLFWSLSQTGNISYTPTSFSLNEMIRKLQDLYRLTAEKKHITVDVAMEEQVQLYADENMIYVTLRNIVSNAIKFTPEGGRVFVNVGKNHQLAEIKVIDEGIGMNKSYLQKLFAEEHLNIKKGTSNEKGTGLGLVLCKKFVDMNNGFMIIKSEENKGTEFTVRLPLAQS